ncbi:hypothetical protein [Coxiella endosymbiont of Dermacentor marginatus]|uniref:hypothetical protein n=1 Tax=Coxiella endosymbiont of Dermacentor marginatus TaxID=1656159 RepID=UPI002223DD94|nr:hypothetical protein [Coxiella endosymbiont of Dermacentor marginatus]
MHYYPIADITSSFLGYVGRISHRELQKVDSGNYTASDVIGKTGIEKYYMGKWALKKLKLMIIGRGVRILKEIPPIPSNNIYLTINSKLQSEAKRILGDESGCYRYYTI